MTYVALLRGINVGGNNKVDMKSLKALFEKHGFARVRTYINSGNIVFEDSKKAAKKLNKLLETIIAKEFKLQVKVLVKTLPEIEKVTKAIPAAWQNNTEFKCDVIFLWPEVDNKAILTEIAINPEVDHIKYTPGAILWSIEREHATRSKISKLVGTKLYAQMTIRNCNTVRKLAILMKEVGE